MWDSASAVCLPPGWEYYNLCAQMGVTFPDYPNTPCGLFGFRGKLNGPTADVRLQVGEGAEWVKILEVGVIRRTSKFGTSFEARRDSATPAGNFELFHLFRHAPCSFRGGARSANGVVSDGKKSDVRHVSRIA